MIGNLISRINDAEKLSQPQLAKTVADGIIPKGIADLVASDKANMSRMMQPTPQVPTGTVADSVMQSAEQSADPLSIIDHKIEVLTKDNLRLHNEIANGEIKPYIGIPKLAEQVKELNSLKSFKLQLEQAQNQQPQAEITQAQGIPSVQNVAQDQQPAGVENLSSNLPQSYADGGILNFQPIDTYDTEHEYAGGGMVAFAGGGDIEDYLDQDNEDDWARISSTNATNEADLIDMIANSGGRPVYRPTGSKGLESLKGEHAKYSGKTEAHPYGEQIMEAAKKHGLDPNFALKLANIETGNLKNPEKAVSPAGAMGVMQLMPSTARGLGVKDPFNPDENISGGVRLAKRLLDKYDGDYKLAAAAYNWGEGNVDKMLKSGKGFEIAPKETQKYVASLAEGGITSLSSGGVAHYANGDLVSNDNPAKNLERYGLTMDTFNPSDFGYNAADVVDNSPRVPSRFSRNAEIGKILSGGKTAADVRKGLSSSSNITSDREVKSMLGRAGPAYQNTPVPGEKVGNDLPDLDKWKAFDAAQKRWEDSLNPKETKTNPSEKSGNNTEDIINKAYEESGTQKDTAPSYDSILRQQLIDDMTAAREQGDMNKYLALMQAGLSMMGGTSPYAATNIGQGGAAGISAFANLQKATNEDIRRIGAQQIGLYNIGEKTKAAAKAAATAEALARDKLGLTGSHYTAQEQLKMKELEALQKDRAQRNLTSIERILAAEWDRKNENVGKPDSERNAFIYGHPFMKKALAEAGIDMSGLGQTSTSTDGWKIVK